MRPEAALRFLDAVDGLAHAARLVCAGYLGGRLRRAAVLTAAGLVALEILISRHY